MNDNFKTMKTTAKIYQENKFKKKESSNNLLGDRGNIICNLQNMLKDQKQKREKIQSNFLLFRQRALQKEIQYRKIIAKYNQVFQNNNYNPKQISQTYNHILINYEEYNQKAEQLLEKRYEELEDFANRKIDNIKNHMQEELGKNKKIPQETYQLICKDMKQVLKIATQIEDKNISIKLELNKVYYSNRVLIEEKNLLLEDIVHKKQIIAKMLKMNRIKVRCSSQDSKRNNLDMTPKTSIVPKYRRQPLSIDLESSIKQEITHRELVSAKKINSNQELLNKITHLKACLEREKKKTLQLGKLIMQLEVKNKHINEAIEKYIQERKPIADMIKDEKVINVLRDIKLKIMMHQSPTISCGWKEQDLSSLVETDCNY